MKRTALIHLLFISTQTKMAFLPPQGEHLYQSSTGHVNVTVLRFGLKTHVVADHPLYNTNACGLVQCSSGVAFTFFLSLNQSPIAEFIFNLNCE